MKAVQIGILAALVVCGALLLKVYRSQEAPAAPPQAAAQAPAPTAAPAAPAPVEQAAAPVTPAPQPEAPAVTPPAAARHKPSPTRVARRESRPAPAEQRTAPASAATVQPAPTPQAPAEAAPASPPAVTAMNPPPSTPVEPPPPPRTPQTVTIPAGTLISVRLAETISTEKNHPGDTFGATLDQPIVIDGFAIAERGAKVQGKIAEAVEAGRVRGLSSLVVQLTRLHTSDGQDVAIRTEPFKKEGPSNTGEDAKKIGVGAAIGAAIGAIAGGGKGAAIGAGVGGAAGAGTVMATRGKPAELPVETRLRFKLQDAVTLTEKLP